MERDDPPKRLSPVFLADAFVDFFDLSTFPRMEEITTLLRRSGVEIVVRSNLDNGRMRGVHTGIKNGPYVIQLDDEWNGAQEHTVLPRDLRDTEGAAPRPLSQNGARTG